MNGFLKDLRFGMRQLAAKPGFAAAAILTLALGIGANTAVFSVLNGYLLKPLPYPHSDRLVQINEDQAKANIRYASISVPNYLSMVNRASDFSAIAAVNWDSLNLTRAGMAQAIPVVRTTASLFDVLQVQPLLGRTFSKESQQPGRGQVVVLSYPFWQHKLGGDPNVVGHTLRFDGKPYTVLGVMPRNFVFQGEPNQLFVPLVFTAEDKTESQRGDNKLKIIGRLKPGVSIEAAGTQLDTVLQTVNRVSATMRARTKKYNIDWWLQPWHAQLVSGRPSLLLLLQAAVLLVLLITCVNVANLLLARILGRTHEMAMRSALGATRGKLARQLLIEGLCLAIPGGAIGVGLAWWSLRFIRQLGWGAESGLFSITPDWRVALFAIAAVILVALAVSLLPIRHFSRTDLQTVLQEGSRATGGGRGARRTRNALVTVELALATALLAGSGLLIHSFIKLQSISPGFNPDNVLTASVVVPAGDHEGTKALASFYNDLIKRVRALPGASAAAVTTQLPFRYGTNGGYGIAGRSISPPPFAWMSIVSSGYFKTLGVPLLRGRAFGPQDTADSEPVVVIDQMLANKYFSDTNPVGQYLVGGGSKYRIIGVVPTLKTSLADEPSMETIYLPVSQGVWRPGLNLIIRTTIPPQALIRPLTKLVGNIDPLVSVTNFKTMHQILADRLQDRHATMLLVLAFGAIALALAIVGMYGVMSYAVSQRRAECGVRLALGALPEDLSWLILKGGLRLLAVGLVLGLGLAVLFGYMMYAQLFGVAPFDPVTLAGSAVVLCAITLAACWLPARRAAKLDPAVAMMEQ
ncbi:MAG TPA: ABC transporter permease [Gammaproteobacteria bacterium]|nr:ABC transporter permease [Gammaproteobacteria bacterium]